MIKIFGRKLCSACQGKKAELDARGVVYTYYDLDTAKGLAEAAYHGLIGRNLSLPIIIEIDPHDHNLIGNPIGQILQDKQDKVFKDSQDKDPKNLVNPVNRRT